MTQILQIQLKYFIYSVTSAFILLIALTFILLSVNTSRTVSINQARQAITIDKAVNDLDEKFKLAAINSRKLQLYRDEPERAKMPVTRADYYDGIQDLRDLVADDQGQQSACDAIRTAGRRFFAAQDEIIRISDEKGTDAAAVAIKDLHSLDLYETENTAVTKFQTVEYAELETKRGEVNYYRNLSSFLSFGALAFLYAVLGIILFSGLQVKRTIEGEN